MENIPPTKAALLQHVRRAAYQAGYVWSQARVPVPVLPSPALCGWLTSDSGWKPFWTELTEASTACYERAYCGCKKGCRRQCKCRASNLQCTELYKCCGACMATTCSIPFLVHSSSHSVSLSLFLVCLYMTHIMTMLLCRLC